MHDTETDTPLPEPGTALTTPVQTAPARVEQPAGNWSSPLAASFGRHESRNTIDRYCQLRGAISTYLRKMGDWMPLADLLNDLFRGGWPRPDLQDSIWVMIGRGEVEIMGPNIRIRIGESRPILLIDEARVPALDDLDRRQREINRKNSETSEAILRAECRRLHPLQNENEQLRMIVDSKNQKRQYVDDVLQKALRILRTKSTRKAKVVPVVELAIRCLRDL